MVSWLDDYGINPTYGLKHQNVLQYGKSGNNRFNENAKSKGLREGLSPLGQLVKQKKRPG